jgi:plastocyanin
MVTRVAVFAAAVGTSAWSGFAQAQAPGDSNEVEELRKEVRQLRARMQQLKSALGEAAELDRMSSDALVRARRVLDGEAALPADPRTSEAPGRSAAPVEGAAGGKVPASARQRAAAAPPAPAPTGTVRGRVDVPAGEPVAYVFVENIRGPAVSGRFTIEQVRKQFVPSWAVVQRGKTIQFPNLDNIYHNVFSLSSGNNFDLGLYAAGGEAKGHTFLEPGVVDVHCNIHPSMAASVLVVPNRYFAKVRPNGSFELTGVPSGRRKIAAWSPGAKISSDWVDLSAGGSAEVTLRLEAKSSGHMRKDGRPYGAYE